ncbi:hypothetical protein J1N35_012165 [Gossypium stocksii]|uniref:SWIM-type domain-containing protein n=1 Tax=Gossypium stocksii TaxID=47602 RepID=A0A9D3W438_9ROSI|nr:hypothetical protein J1N35_012165 [Gossypium stocksii]
MHPVCYAHKDLLFQVTKFDRSDQGIVGGAFRVHLRQRTCDCERFNALHFPCAHTIVTCSNQCLNHMSFVDKVYRVKHMYNVWRNVFPLVPNERMWPSVSSAPFKMLPDRLLRRQPIDSDTQQHGHSREDKPIEIMWVV